MADILVDTDESTLVTGTAADDSIFGSVDDPVVINAGEGNDTIDLSGDASGSSIDTGDADDGDSVYLADGGSNITVTSGSGDDTVYIDDSDSNSVSSGAGDDSIYLSGGNGNTADAGDGE